jgi:hypothetical protein
MTHWRRPPVPTSLFAACVVSLLVAACGSSSPTSTSASSPGGDNPTQAQAQQDMVAFSGCMRSHGASNFPDPGARGFKYELAPSTPHSPAFRSAYTACGHLLPTDGAPGQGAAHSPAQIAAFLAFARCIRGQGFPTFPDPTSSGQLTHEMVANAGINLHQPAVLRAGDACVGVTHGYITKTDVARFVAGQ